MKIRRAKLEAKVYTLRDELGLSLIIEPNGSRVGYSAIVLPVSLKWSRLMFIRRSDWPMLRSVVTVPENWLPQEKPSGVRKEQKIALQTASESAFDKLVNGVRCVSTRPVCEIKPLELISLMLKIEKCCALEKMWRVQKSYSVVFRYAIAPGRAEFNPAADLLRPQSTSIQSFPVPKSWWIPNFMHSLDSKIGSNLVQIALNYLWLWE